MRHTDITDILLAAKALLADPKRIYQTRLIAALDTGELEPYYDSKRVQRWRPKWTVCRPQTPGAMLSLRGAIIASCPSAPASWRVFETMAYHGYNLLSEPATKYEAITLLISCVNALQRANRSTPKLSTEVLVDA